MGRKQRFFWIIPGVCLLTAACSPRIYRPPALGAEYRFDEGLKKPKGGPEELFDPKMRDYLRKKGIQGKTTAPPAPTPADSTHRRTADTLTNPGSPASPASTDSSHNAPR
jgi:hypothetical protein